MARHPRILAPAGLLLLVAACGGGEPGPTGYRFLVAGHAYGRPSQPQPWPDVHPPFAAWLAEAPPTDFVVLTGDAVRVGTPERYARLEAAFADYPGDRYLVPGNHEFVPDEWAADHPERLTREAWVARFGPMHGAFRHGGDLHLWLDGNLDGWNVSGDQLEFVRETLATHADARNVFVHVHHVIWYDPQDPARACTPNSTFRMADELTFRAELEPVLRQAGKPVHVIAGDVGASAEAASHWYRRDGDLRLIASGMGHPGKDTVLLVTVDGAGQASFQLIGLTEATALGRLEDHPADDVGRD